MESTPVLEFDYKLCSRLLGTEKPKRDDIAQLITEYRYSVDAYLRLADKHDELRKENEILNAENKILKETANG